MGEPAAQLWTPGQRDIGGDVLVPVQGGWLDARIPAIAATIHEKDPNLVLIARVSETSRTVDQYELHRQVADGKTVFIGAWPPGQEDRILTDFALMDPTAPGYVSAVERIRRAHDARDQENQRVWRENYEEALDYGAALFNELEHGKQSHYQVGGSKETAGGSPKVEGPRRDPQSASGETS